MRKLFLPIFIVLLAACTEKETWCSDDSMKLEFSKDTVAFDTIVATVGSSTKTLVVYNKNKKGMRVKVTVAEGDFVEENDVLVELA